jgi:CHAT domain-containing protein
VADPQGDLPEARKEAAAVAAEIRAWGPGWSLKRLDGSAARAGRVLRALPTAAIFHYAGHGRFAGFAGWDSSLPLADGSRLNLGDVLALHPAPAWVVLSSCDAGRSSEQAPGEGIGLANAFVLAGSQAVIAAPRQVADRTARDLLGDLYRSWRPGEDLPRQLQRAQLACRRNTPAADWASFRVLTP